MEITYLGHSSFKLRGKSAVLVTDPFDPDFVGLKYPKTQADIVTISHPHKDHNFSEIIEGGPFIISSAGEYEIKEISVFGFSSFHDAKSGEERGKNVIYLIEMEGLKICHLGDLGSSLSSEIIEEIGVADILMLPVGGKVTIGSAEAAELIRQIEPSLVLPMHYKTSGLKESFDDLAPVEEFLSKMGVETPEKTDKLVVSKDKLPEEMKIILLERRT